MFDRRVLIGAIILVGVTIVASPACTQEKSVVVASTTSAQDSGLFDYLLPIFKQKTGITVKVLALGTGQARTAPPRCRTLRSRAWKPSSPVSMRPGARFCRFKSRCRILRAS